MYGENSMRNTEHTILAPGGSEKKMEDAVSWRATRGSVLWFRVRSEAACLTHQQPERPRQWSCCSRAHTGGEVCALACAWASVQAHAAHICSVPTQMPANCSDELTYIYSHFLRYVSRGVVFTMTVLGSPAGGVWCSERGHKTGLERGGQRFSTPICWGNERENASRVLHRASLRIRVWQQLTNTWTVCGQLRYFTWEHGMYGRTNKIYWLM